jgi:hypothetical protein
MVMNGGLGHAFDVFEDEEVVAAVDGFRFFGFDDLALFLENAAELTEEKQEELSSKYEEFVPSNNTIAVAFEAVL